MLTPSTAPDPVKSSTYLTPAIVPILAVSGANVTVPMQVVRELPLHATTELTNVRYQTALRGSVWENYMLVVTSGPLIPMVLAELHFRLIPWPKLGYERDQHGNGDVLSGIGFLYDLPL